MSDGKRMSEGGKRFSTDARRGPQLVLGAEDPAPEGASLLRHLKAQFSEAQQQLASQHEQILGLVMKHVELPRASLTFATKNSSTSNAGCGSSSTLKPPVESRGSSRGSTKSTPHESSLPLGNIFDLHKATPPLTMSAEHDSSSDSDAAQREAEKKTKISFRSCSSEVSGVSGEWGQSSIHSIGDGRGSLRGKEVVEVLPVWKNQKRKAKQRRKCDPSSKEIMTAAAHLLRASLAEHEFNDYDALSKTQQAHSRCVECGEWAESRVQGLILQPTSLKRGGWDIASLLLALWDLVTIPLLVFEPPETQLNAVMDWTTRLFWTFDIFVSFLTGYVDTDGSVMMRPRRICARYMRLWFVLDLGIVCLDWLELMFSRETPGENAHGYARAGRAARAMRIVRMLRLIRLLRIQSIMKLFIERLQSEMVLIVVRMAKIVVVIIGLAHLIACMWWGVGRAGEPRNNWIATYGYVDRSLGYCYTSSLQWALLLFGGGMDELNPTNTLERVYAIAVFLLAYVTAILFVSNLTSSMTQLHMLTSHKAQSLFTLRRYLNTNGISSKLTMRVLRNAQHAAAERLRVMPEEDVELLGEVSEPLRSEIHFEMYLPVLQSHAFLRRYAEERSEVMSCVCHRAVSSLMVSKADAIFNHGEIPPRPRMYIVCSGELVYVSVTQGRVHVGPGTCISEAALWTHWMHRGMLMAFSDCRLFSLDANAFQEIVGEFDHSHNRLDPRRYAHDFVDKLNSLDQDLWSDLPLRMMDQNITEPFSSQRSENSSVVAPERPQLSRGKRKSLCVSVQNFMQEPADGRDGHAPLPPASLDGVFPHYGSQVSISPPASPFLRPGAGKA